MNAVVELAERLTDEERVSLHALARQVLENTDTPDPADIAVESFDDLSEEALRELALFGWREYLRIAIRQGRARRTVSNSSPGWDNVRQMRESGALAIMREGYWTGTDWKLLGDCNRNDIFNIAESYQKRADINARTAERFLRLLEVMKKSRVQTVADLSHTKLETVWDA